MQNLFLTLFLFSLLQLFIMWLNCENNILFGFDETWIVAFVMSFQNDITFGFNILVFALSSLMHKSKIIINVPSHLKFVQEVMDCYTNWNTNCHFLEDYWIEYIGKPIVWSKQCTQTFCFVVEQSSMTLSFRRGFVNRSKSKVCFSFLYLLEICTFLKDNTYKNKAQLATRKKG